jgi:MFS family permease
MGGILTLKVFLDAFPMINPEAPGLTHAESSTRSTYQGIAVASYNLGCFLGAIITIFVGNPLGRKRVIMLGTAIMIIGAILQASATTLEQFIVGRIITGLGNGGNTSTVGIPWNLAHIWSRLPRLTPPPRFPLGSPRPPKPTNAARWS